MTVQLLCDLDDSEVEAVETVSFGYGGATYAFELCKAHLAEFNETMGRYVGCARREGGRRRGPTPRSVTAVTAPKRVRSDREELQAIRDWARANGRQVSDRGRIAGEVRAAFETAQAKGKRK